MLSNFALQPRLFVSICAAVVLFTVRSDAARVSHTATQKYSGVTYHVPRRLYTPYSQHRPTSVGLLSTETGLHTGTGDETGTSWNYGGTPSIIDQQSKPFQFTQGIYSDSQNRPDNRQKIKVQRGHRADGARPASSFFTSRSSHQHGGQSSESWQSKQNNHAVTQKETPTGNPHNSHSVIVRKQSPEKAGSHRSSSFSHGRDQKYIPKPYSEGQVARSDSSKMAEDKSARKSFSFSLSPSQTGAYWETPRGHSSDYKEINESPAVGAQSTSSGSQSSNFFSSGSHLAPRVTSISDSSDTPVIKRTPSVQKLTSSITDFTHGPDSESSSETHRHKKVQAYLLKGPQTSVNKVKDDGREALSGLSSISTMPDKQRRSDAPASSRFESNFYNMKDSTKQANANLLYQHTGAAQYDSQMQKGLNRDQPISSLQLPRHITAPSPPQVALHPAPVKSQIMESFSPASSVNSRHGYATRDSVQNDKQGGPAESTYGFREFKNPLWPAVKKAAVPTFKEQNNSKQYSFDNVKDYKFKVSSIYPALLPKYSFVQRRGSSALQTPMTMVTTPTPSVTPLTPTSPTQTTPTTTPPVKLERNPTDYPSPSPSTLIQITTPTLSVSPFKQVHPLKPNGDAGMDRNTDRQFRTYKMINDLKGSDSQPLEGAKPSVQGPDKSTTLQQDSVRAGSPQIWQPRSFRIHNQTESGLSNTSTSGPNEPSSEDHKPHLKTAGDSETVTLDTRRLYTFRRFKSIKNTTAQARDTLQWQYPMQDPAAASYIVSSAYLRSQGSLRFASRLTSELGTPNKNNPAAVKPILLNTSTTRSVRAKRVRVKQKNGKKLSDSILTNSPAAIVRLPKRSATVKAVTYTDVLGNASFSGIKATSQAPDTSTDMVHYPDVTAMTGQPRTVSLWTLNSDEGVHSGQNMNQTSEPNAEDGNISRAEINKVSESKEADNELKTSAFLNNEESGSGGSSLPEVLSSGTASHAFSKDLLELEYLRISTENLSFKSVNLSHPDTKPMEM